MKFSYSFFLICLFPIINNAMQFKEPVLTQMYRGITTYVDLGATLPNNDKNNCVAIYKKMLAEAQEQGLEALVSDPSARIIQNEIFDEVKQDEKYKATLLEAYAKNQLEAWGTFRKQALYLIVPKLKNKGLFFPDKLPDNTGFLEGNRNLDCQKDYSLVKAAVMLLYTPMQIQENFTAH